LNKKNNFVKTIPNVTLQNVKIISNGAIIYYNISLPDIDIKNYGLYGNKNIDNEHITLGIGDFNNFVFIYSNDLT